MARRVRIKGRLLTARETRQRQQRIHQRAVARKRAALNDPARVVAPLTPRTLRREEEAAARLKYQPLERELAQRQVNIPSWFDQYKADVAARQQRMAEEATRIRAEVDARAAAQAPSSGSPEAQQAAEARRAQIQAFASNLGAQDVARGQYSTARQDVAEREKLAELLRARQQQTQLGQEKADFRLQYRTEARERERKYGLERQAFGLNVAKAETEARSKRSQARARRQQQRQQQAKEQRRQMEADRKFRLDLRKYGLQEAKDRYQKRHGLGPYKPPSSGRGGGKKGGKKPTQAEYKGRQAILQAQQQYRNFRGDYQKYLRSGRRHGVPLPIIHAGYELEKQGFVGPNTTRQLREIGIRVPSRWRRRPSRTPRRPGARP